MGIFSRKVSHPSRRVPNVAAIIGDNLVPIAGVALLQWKAANLVLLYFAGFLFDIAACVLLLWNLDPDRHRIMAMPDTPANRVKLVLSLALGVGVLLAVFGMAFGFPVFAIVAAEPGLSVGALLADRGFMTALALHALMAGHGFIHVYRGFAREAKEDPTFQVVLPVRRRFGYITSRWLVVLVVSFVLPFAALLVVAYCAASVWYELKASRRA